MKILNIIPLLISVFVFSQLTMKKEKILGILTKTQIAESQYIGESGEESIIFRKFNHVKNKLSNNDLYNLALRGSNALRLYSSQELVFRNDKRIINVYKYYQKNIHPVSYMQGCIQEKINLTDVIENEYKKLVIRIKYLEETDNKSVEFQKLHEIIDGDFLQNYETIKTLKISVKL